MLDCDEETALSPRATGLALSTHLHLTSIREGFLRALDLAALLLLSVAGLASRRSADAALRPSPSSLPLAPIALGFVWTLGLMGWLGIPLSAANVIALTEVLGGTGAAPLLALLTTLLAFGSLMLTDYGAMRSLGLVMSLGLCANLVTSLILLPAWLCWRRRLHCPRGPRPPSGRPRPAGRPHPLAPVPRRLSALRRFAVMLGAPDASRGGSDSDAELRGAGRG